MASFSNTTTFVSSSSDGKLLLFDSKEPMQSQTLAVSKKKKIELLDLSSDDKYLIEGYQWMLKLRKLKENQIVAKFECFSSRLSGLRFCLPQAE